jgi:putative tryptophan/tyrosine transport system substrate-binding protein
MRRRDLLGLVVGTAIASARFARAQRRSLPLVAFLSPRTAEMHVGAFWRGLHELGYLEGKNFLVETRSADGDDRRLPALAAELTALKPDVIVTYGELAIRATKEFAGTIPIVMAVVDDPVRLGFAHSLAHPGGNLTGLSIQAVDVLGKRLQLLHETVPEAGCIAVLGRTGGNYDPGASPGLTAAARELGVALLPISVTAASELPTGFAEITRHHCRALLAMSTPWFVDARRQLVELSLQHRIAANYDNKLIVDAGGLMSYGPDTVDMFRRSAVFVDKILRGAKPADLPIEQPIQFKMAINLNTAKALGLTFPQSILTRADEVIE